MNSRQRMQAAINGESPDRYPFINPYPMFSMMPHWPQMLSLTWLHVQYGSDAQRLACHRALNEQIGLDWAPTGYGPCGQDQRFGIRTDDGVPVLTDLQSGDQTRFEELPRDLTRQTPEFESVADVEAAPAPPTVDDILAGDGLDFTRKMVAEMGDDVFLYGGVGGPFSSVYRALTFEGVYAAILDNPPLVHALAERAVAYNTAHIRAIAQTGVHAVRINEYPCGGELMSDEHFRTFVLPYLRQTVRAIRDAGMVVILEYLGWVQPRLKHIAALDVDCLQTESSLKNYRNDIGEIRAAVGDGVCLFSNSRILQVIEQGSEPTWRADAAEQARGIGAARRFAICAGSPTTWNTDPDRLRRYGTVMQQALAEFVPPRQA